MVSTLLETSRVKVRLLGGWDDVALEMIEDFDLRHLCDCSTLPLIKNQAEEKRQYPGNSACRYGRG